MPHAGRVVEVDGPPLGRVHDRADERGEREAAPMRRLREGAVRAQRDGRLVPVEGRSDGGLLRRRKRRDLRWGQRR